MAEQIKIGERVLVEAGKARKRILATVENLFAIKYVHQMPLAAAVAQQAGEQVELPQGWRAADAIGPGFMMRAFDAQGRRFEVGDEIQYLDSSHVVWYVYELHAVRDPLPGPDGVYAVQPRYVPVDWAESPEAAANRAAERAAALPPLTDENEDGIIDYRDMPVVEVSPPIVVEG